jgi:hypothetical protein
MEKLAVSEHQEANQPIPESTTSPQPQETESPTPRPSEAASQAPDQPAPQAQQPKQLIETGKQAIAKLTNKLKQVSSSPPKETSELQEKLKQEIGTAWQFTKDKVFPGIL